MQALPFIPKENQELPDYYGVLIQYVNGKKEEFEIASHKIIENYQVVEFVTKDDQWNFIPISSIQRIEFNKDFSKIVDLNQRRQANGA